MEHLILFYILYIAHVLCLLLFVFLSALCFRIFVAPNQLELFVAETTYVEAGKNKIIGTESSSIFENGILLVEDEDELFRMKNIKMEYDTIPASKTIVEEIKRAHEAKGGL